jgi:hypothetical protein
MRTISSWQQRSTGWRSRQLATAVMNAGGGLSLPDYGRRWRDRISGPTLFPVAVDPIAPNDDFAWSAFANETPFLNPTDLDASTPVRGSLSYNKTWPTYSILSPGARQLPAQLIERTWLGRFGVPDCHVAGTIIRCRAT